MAFITLPQSPVTAGESGHLTDHNDIYAALVALWGAVPQGRVNVKAPPYNAAGDGATDDTTAIQNALNAVPVGGVVYFPNGVYEISSPLTVSVAGTKLMGEKASSAFSAGGANQTVIDAKAGFTGAEMIQASGVPDFAMRDLTIHATNTSGATIGINIVTSGSCMLENVLVARTAGDGIYLSGVDPVVMRQVGVYHAGVSSSAGYGINIQGIADSWYTNVLCAGCYTAGWNIQGGDNSTFTACRAEDGPAGYGFYFHDKTGLFGGTSFVQCTTDLNFADGFRISNLTAGNGVIQLVGCEFRRDGNNSNAGGGSYSGIAVAGTTIPVLLVGTTVTARQGTSGADAPQYGLTMTTSSLVSVDGGYYSCAASGGSIFNHDTNGTLVLGPNMIGATVSSSTPTVYQLGEIFATNASATVINNSTTFVNVTGMVAPSLPANSKWFIEGIVYYDASTTSDIKLQWVLPSGASLTMSAMGGGTGAATAPVNMGDQQRTAAAAAYGGVGVGTIVDVVFKGILTIGATAGTAQLQAAQNTLDATNCTVDTGSYLRLKQIS